MLVGAVAAGLLVAEFSVLANLSPSEPLTSLDSPTVAVQVLGSVPVVVTFKLSELVSLPPISVFEGRPRFFAVENNFVFKL